MIFETKRSIEKNYFYTQTDENLTFCSHVHNSYEFITVTEGELECSVYQESFVLKPGTAMLILPNHVHSYRTVNASRSFLCIFSADYIAEFDKEVQTGRGGVMPFPCSDLRTTVQSTFYAIPSPINICYSPCFTEFAEERRIGS